MSDGNGGRDTATLVFSADRLTSYVTEVLLRLGLPAEDAARANDVLITTSLRGVDTHGLFLFPSYVKRLRLGLINPSPNLAITVDGGSILQIDGDNGLGQVVASRAMEMCIDRAAETGLAAAAVRRSNHLGAADYYAMMALNRRMMGIAISNGTAVMAPWGAAQPFFATNPLAVAIPCGRHDPVVFDMATSVAARSKIILAKARGEAIPEGWAIDRAGLPTSSPEEALIGAMLPVGGPKGYGLALVFEVLSAILSGGHYGPHIRGLHEDLTGPQGTCFFLAAVCIDKIMPVGEFESRIDAMIDEIKKLKPAEGVSKILIPGESRRRRELERLDRGIPVDDKLFRELSSIGESLGVALQPS